MQSAWFKEDREQYSGDELKAAIEESKKALQNSTLMQRRLEKILEEMIEETYRNEEDYLEPNYAVRCAANAGRRRAFREVKKLVQFK